MTFKEYIAQNSFSGRINEIIDLTTQYFNCKLSELTSEQIINALCYAQNVTPQQIDDVISTHSEVLRTVKGHTFEVVFDYVMSCNNIDSIEVGGDGDVDRIVNENTLQLKTPYLKGCTKNIISYKTHKTHGAKSEKESMSYYHRVDDFADYLVGLISYTPFDILIIPKEELPRTKNSADYIQSPMFLDKTNPKYLNGYAQIGINKVLPLSRTFLI